MRWRYLPVQRSLCIITLCILLPGISYAKDWYDYYHQAREAAQTQKWTAAITLLEKSIAEEPEPDRRKKYGMRSFAYYPYLELGMAYLAIGKMEIAHQQCTIAKQKDAAPQELIATCLSIASPYITKATPPPQPPTPTPTLLASQPSTEPSIEITSRPPSTTKDDAIVLQGAAIDPSGISGIKFHVENRGITGITTLATPERPEEPFNIKIPLDFGLTEITIEATNTQGAKTTQIITVDRLSPNVPTATPIPPTVTPIPPTATPTPPTPAPILPVATPVLPTPTPIPPTPKPVLSTPTPSVIDQLLQEGDRYFDERWFMTGPDGKNAFDVYKQVLQLEPTNTHARDQLYTMMRTYKTWGESNANKGNKEKAQTYYERYLEIGLYLNLTLENMSIREELEEVRAYVDLLAATPTPIPHIPTATPVIPPATPVPLLPTATPVPRIPTATPIPPQNIPPTLNILSEIPAQTTEATLTITGVASDAEGVAEIQVEVTAPGTRGLVLEVDDQASRGPQSQVQFSRNVELALGLNDIQVIARNTAGQENRERFQVTRIAVATSAPTTSSQGDIYAVIIGIGEYADNRLNLKYTVNDAQGLYDVLTDPQHGGVPPDNIQLLLNEEATDRNIKRAVGRWLSQHADDDDTVIIYYSGHGAPEANETYWVTYNADIDDLYTTALSNHEIANMLDRVRSKRMVTFLDSCYSAATVHRQNRTRDVATEIPWDKFTGTGRVTISASDGKQLSLELDKYQHGVFTYYLLEGLRGNADTNRDYVVEVEEIWDYVKYNVIDTARKAGNNQTPVFQGSMTAGIVLTVNQTGLDKQEKLDSLSTLFEQGVLSFEHFDCAFRMVEAEEGNRYLDGLLSDKLSPAVFERFFTCP